MLGQDLRLYLTLREADVLQDINGREAVAATVGIDLDQGVGAALLDAHELTQNVRTFVEDVLLIAVRQHVRDVEVVILRDLEVGNEIDAFARDLHAFERIAARAAYQ